MNLRPAQADILEYRNGRLAISAVPGSGKTFTLSLLAAQLIAEGRVNPQAGQQILIVTYLNASVDTFKARIRKRLDDLELPPIGFDVRTLHSLALEIVKLSESGIGEQTADPVVLDDTQSGHALSLATDAWIETHPNEWAAFLPDNIPKMRARWRDIAERTARAFISVAKNQRHSPRAIADQLAAGATGDLPLLKMMVGIYGRYQETLARQGAFDFDDLIWNATDLLHNRPHFARELQARWPYILEDEAQDSVPLQEILINNLSGSDGNWVRVGDPNQAITSAFTAADPRFFTAFADRPDVVSLPLPNSGRSAPLIMGAANAMLHWVIDKHPVEEVRQNTFRRQDILPTPPGDAQPNPPDSEANIRIKVYKNREDEELPSIAKLAHRYVNERPSQTIAILVPTNRIGFNVADILDDLDADYDNLLRGGGQEKEIAAAMHALIALLADPLNKKALVNAHAALYELGHPAAAVDEEELDKFHALLRSVHRPEALIFPWDDADVATALPVGVASEDHVARAARLGEFLARIFALRPLPIDDLALALGDELFGWGEGGEANIAIAYQIAAVMRRWRDTNPEWRLPELADQLADVANGRRKLQLASPMDAGYEPQPGRITLTTQHSAKGLEWDAVFLVGVDGYWIPGTLDAYFQGSHDFLGGDPIAEAAAQLHYVMEGDARLFPERTATESAHINVISERLRLLYVGITRAKRYLHLSRSRATRQWDKEKQSEPTAVMGVLYAYLKTARALG